MPFPAYASYVETLESEARPVEFEHITFNVDKVHRGNYMGFRITGESMNGGRIDDVPGNTPVLARELGRQHWKDGFKQAPHGWIIACHENIFHKDILDLDSEGNITLHSRNPSPEYADFKVNLNTCYKIFKIHKRIM